LIASFGGFIMLTGAYQQELRFSEDAAQKIKDMRNQLASYQEAKDKVKKLRQEGDRIFEQVLQSLSQNSSVQNVVRRCGEDTCIDLYIHFETDKDEIFNGNERGALEKIGAAKLSNRGHRLRRFATFSWLRPREAGLLRQESPNDSAVTRRSASNRIAA